MTSSKFILSPTILQPSVLIFNSILKQVLLDPKQFLLFITNLLLDFSQENSVYMYKKYNILIYLYMKT